MIPLLFLMVYMGVYPRPFLNASRQSVVAIQERVVRQSGGTIETVNTNPKPQMNTSEH
jgi:NADH:ubiquinone oxidoreductase subunit 4 (subunit M)